MTFDNEEIALIGGVFTAATLQELLARAWDKGFDAGDGTPQGENPYRSGNDLGWYPPGQEPHVPRPDTDNDNDTEETQ